MWLLHLCSWICPGRKDRLEALLDVLQGEDFLADNIAKGLP
jgi:hypothetical protein